MLSRGPIVCVCACVPEYMRTCVCVCVCACVRACTSVSSPDAVSVPVCERTVQRTKRDLLSTDGTPGESLWVVGRSSKTFFVQLIVVK